MNSRLGPGEERGRRSQGKWTLTRTPRPTCVLGYSVHILLPHLGHVAQHGEDDKAGQEAGQTVDRAGDQSVPATWKEEDGTAGKRQFIPNVTFASQQNAWRPPEHLESLLVRRVLK